MSTTPVSAGSAETSAEQNHGAKEMLDLVDRWKTRVDEIRVQLDLAKLDLRDHATRQLELARNANFAATPKLRAAYHDASATAQALRDGVDELLDDVKEAFAAVQEVLDRN